MSNRHESIVFLILHYFLFNETVQSVDVLLYTFSQYNINIVIVDNASPNGSGHLLKDMYAAEHRVHVLLSQENLGFAKGNNLGYQYIKENIYSDFVVILNNDVVIAQPDFIDEIIRLFHEKGFAVLGPDIYVPSLGIHQNPKRLNGYCINEVNELTEKYQRMLSNERLIKARNILKKFESLRSLVIRMRRNREGISWNVEHANPILHGACFIVSRIFLDAREYALNPGTFMYYEMEILREECLKENLTTLYSPTIQVEHHHSVSTRLAHEDPVERTMFMYESILQSLTVLAATLTE